MRIIPSLLASFVAICTATPGTPTSRPDSNNAFDNVLPSEPTQIDGHWRIGCDENNYCSYYQATAVATGIAALGSASAHSVNDVECQGCTTDKSCLGCPTSVFKCADCKHFQCADNSTKAPICIDVPHERLSKSDGTTTFTRSDKAPGINVTSTAVAIDMENERHVRPRQNISFSGDMYPLFGRHAAFSGDQCVDCDSAECPECYSDCAECQHFKCVDPTSRLSMCMSVRPKYLVPCDPIPPPVSIVTKTVYFLPVSTPTSASTIIIKNTPRSMATIASLASPSVVTVSAIVTKTTTVYTPAPSKSTTTKYVEVSIVPVTRSRTSFSYEPSTKPIVIASGDRSIIPRARVTSSPDLSRIMTNAARATPVSELLSRQQYNTKEASCKVCQDASDCKGCEFVCPGCGGHMLCENPYNASYLCVEILGNTDAPRVHDASTAPEQSLGYAATLLAPQDANELVAANFSENVKALVKSEDKVSLSFNPAYCHVCNSGDAVCSGCNWRFTCSDKMKCSESSGSAALEVCYEKGQLCAA